ncbi:MAG: hypothetical protein ACLRSW_09145 [Christensenellaceae bacterium]
MKIEITVTGTVHNIRMMSDFAFVISHSAGDDTMRLCGTFPITAPAELKRGMCGKTDGQGSCRRNERRAKR